MYTVQRTEDRIIITDWEGRVVYASLKDSYLIYNADVGFPVVEKIGEMNDRNILLNLSKAIKLSV